MGGEVLIRSTRVRLDWSASEHWSDTMRSCRRCRTLTHGRDEQGRACHQSCQEEELASEMAGQLGLADERVTPSGGYRRPAMRAVAW